MSVGFFRWENIFGGWGWVVVNEGGCTEDIH